MQLAVNKNPTNRKIKMMDNGMPKNLVCFSHLRWDFVFQRPQHLLTRFSRCSSVFFIEEPVFDAKDKGHYTISKREDVFIVLPHLPTGLSNEESLIRQKSMFDKFMDNKNLADYGFWYYTPMALEFSRKYSPELIIYDCMDELSAFKFAPEELKNLEKELIKKADIVFTGGHSLYEAKKNQHGNIYSFPSSIDKDHFKKARSCKKSPPDQIKTTKPKLGFYGVIDERFDIELIKGIADARPDWQIILIGPVVKIDPSTLPDNNNIHYLGPKTYAELPLYLSDWNIALIPFLINDSTRFISPTKTPEYLAGGVPVISTPIKDVVNPYGKKRLVTVCKNVSGFIAAIEKELQSKEKDKWLKQVDNYLEQISWDETCLLMLNVIKETTENRSINSIAQ